MGRRKVNPENRLRASQACLQCRVSKKRCDSLLPCSKCIRRGMSNSCTFASAAARHESSVTTPRGALPLEQPKPTDPPSRPQQTLEQPLRSDYGQSSPDVDAEEDSPEEARHRTHPRLLSNAQGERGIVHRHKNAQCFLGPDGLALSLHGIVGVASLSTVHTKCCHRFHGCL